MTPVRCPACSGAAQPDAHYCAACGASLDPTVIHLGRVLAEDGQRSRRSSLRPDDPDDASPVLRRLGVPLGVVGLFALLGLLLFAPSGGEDDDAAGEPRPTSTTRPAALLPAIEAPSVRPTPTPRPSSTPRPTPAPVDAAELPETSATHLAVITTDTARFLDLRSGEWTEAPLDGTFDPWSRLMPFGDGLLVRDANGDRAWSVRPGTEPLRIGDVDEYVIAVESDLAVIQSYDRMQTMPTYRWVRPDGEEVRSMTLPPGAWTSSVTPEADLVVQRGTTVYVVSESDQRAIGEGFVAGVFERWVFISDCPSFDRCETMVFDLAAGATETVIDGVGWLDADLSGTSTTFYDESGTATRSFTTDDGQLVEIDPATIEPPFSPPDPFAETVDGVTAAGSGREITIAGAGREVVVTIASRANNPAVGLLFLTVDEASSSGSGGTTGN